MRPGEPEVERQPWLQVLAVGSALAVLLLGLLPGWLFEMASKAILQIF